MELNDRTSSYREATTTPSAEPADGAAAVEETPADTVVEVKTGRTNVRSAHLPQMPHHETRMIRRLCRRRYHAGLQRLPFASLHNAVRTTGTTQGTTQCYRDTGGYATCCVPLVERLTSVFLFLSSHFPFFFGSSSILLSLPSF